MSEGTASYSNTPTGFLCTEVNEKLFKLMNDNPQSNERIAGICDICRDAITLRFTTIFDYPLEYLPPYVLLDEACF